MSKLKTIKTKFKTPTKKEIYKMAQNKGIKTTIKVNIAKPIIKNRHKSKDQLIKDIQLAEGNNVCYKLITNCNSTNCLWYDSCQK